MQLKAHGLLEAGLPQPPEAPAAPRPTRLRARPAVTRDLARRRLPHAWRQLPLHGPLHRRLQALVLALVRPPPAATQLARVRRMPSRLHVGGRPATTLGAWPQRSRRSMRHASLCLLHAGRPHQRTKAGTMQPHAKLPRCQAQPDLREVPLVEIRVARRQRRAGREPCACIRALQQEQPPDSESHTTSAPAGTATPHPQLTTPASTAANACRNARLVYTGEAACTWAAAPAAPAARPRAAASGCRAAGRA